MNEYDDLAATLTRELHEQVDDMGSTLDLGSVQGRARSIRRRRTAIAVASVAAAVAVIVPTVSLLDHTGGRRISPAPAPSTTTTERVHLPAPGVLDVSALPMGDAPRMEYVTDGRTLHRVDGSTAEIRTRYPVSSFAELADGTHLWLTSHDGTPYVEVEDSQGNLLDPVRSRWGIGVNSDDSVGAWVRSDGQVMVWQSGATEPHALGEPIISASDLQVGPVLGDKDSCRTHGYCSVLVNGMDARGARDIWDVSDLGTQRYTDGGLVTIADVAGSVTVGRSELTDSGSCSSLFGGGEFQGFDTCKATLMSFSPDGSTLLGYPPYWDGLGPTSISMWDLKGRQLFERHSDVKSQTTIADAQWEDGTHLLSSMFMDGRWSLVRLAPDGSMEYAVAPVAAAAERSPFVLETS
jgi:hypothetical protein